MRCLGCHRQLDDDSDSSYHRRCANNLFGAKQVPSISFTYPDITIEARKLVGQMSISGVQAKLSVRLSGGRIEVTAHGGTHILKPSPEHFLNLAENENLCMNIAGELSIETPPHGLLPLSDGKLVYIVRRFDRESTKQGISKIQVEDFAQLLGKHDKYDGSIEQIGKFLKLHSEIPFIDTQKLFVRAFFYFLIGNGDAHMKNLAMIKPPDKGYRLAPAYDIINSRLVMPDETDEMAISLNGRRNNISVRDFRALADYLEMNDKAYQNILNQVMSLNTKINNIVEPSFLPKNLKEQFLVIFSERHKRLFG